MLISIALALDLLLIVFEGLLPNALHGILPLGGNHLTQVGALLATAIVVDVLWQTFRGRPPPYL